MHDAHSEGLALLALVQIAKYAGRADVLPLALKVIFFPHPSQDPCTSLYVCACMTVYCFRAHSLCGFAEALYLTLRRAPVRPWARAGGGALAA